MYQCMVHAAIKNISFLYIEVLIHTFHITAQVTETHFHINIMIDVEVFSPQKPPVRWLPAVLICSLYIIYVFVPTQQILQCCFVHFEYCSCSYSRLHLTVRRLQVICVCLQIMATIQ